MASDTKKARYDVSSQVKDAIERGDRIEVARILSECSRRDSDSIMTQLVSRDQWDAVNQVIRCVGDKERTWDIGSVLVKNNILLSVAMGNWWEISEIPHTRFHHSTLEWILQQACTRARQTDIVQYVLPHCEDDQLDSVLTTLVERRLWRAVREALKRSVNHAVKQWAVREACTVCDDADSCVLQYIIPHCADDQLDSVLTTLVERRLWRVVGEVLKRGVSDSVKQWAVNEACQHVGETGSCYLHNILPHCADDQLDSVLTTLVERRLWEAVGDMLKRGVCHSVKQWAVSKACEDCCDPNDYVLKQQILPHCAEDQLDSVLTTLVERRLWRAVEEVLNRGVSDSVKRWAVKRALTYENCIPDSNFIGAHFRLLRTMNTVCNDDQSIVPILLHCTDDQLDSVLTTLVERRVWWEVGEVLKRGVSDSLKQWAVAEACQHCYIKDLQYILPLCADDQLDCMLTTLVERRLWWAVIKVLKRGVSDSVKRWAVEKACVASDQNFITQHIIPLCPDDQLDSVLTTLVERRLWQAVGEVLKRGVSDSFKRRAVEEACVASDQYTIAQHILPYCAEDQLDSVLTTLAERGVWWAVGEAMKRGVSDSVKRWAVEKACVACDQNLITQHILPHCADDQLDSVLTTLVERRVWRAVEKLLRRDVSESVKGWAVKKALTYYKDDINAYDQSIVPILPHCTDDQVDSVLTALVERRQWGAVGEVLTRGVSDSVKQLAVLEACTYYEHHIYHVADLNNILRYCHGDLLDSVLTTLVEQRRWLIVGYILKQSACDLKQQWNKHKTCGHCTLAEVYFSDECAAVMSCMESKSLQDYAGDDLDLHQTAPTGRDECTAMRLESGREVSDAKRRAYIKAAFRYADEDILINNILPYYVYDSMRSALMMLSSRHFWSAFVRMLHYCTIDTLHMCAHGKDTESTDEVFWDMVRNPCDGVKGLTPAMWRSITWSGLQRSLKQLLDWDTPLCEVLCESLLAIVKEIWVSGRESEIHIQKQKVLVEALSTVEHLHQQIKPFLMKWKTSYESEALLCTEGLRNNYAERCCEKSRFLQLCFIKCLVQQYYKRKAWTQMTDAILIVLTTVPVVPDVQSVTLRVMLRHNRWDVISHACLSGVCEQDRRQLFQAAVKQRQWSAVKRWADHALYDDQRLWALGEARQEKRWDVYSKLADHGLSEWERMGVLFRVTMQADWKLVCHMLRTVADVTDMIDLLTITPGTLSKLGAKKYEQRMNELEVFEKTLKKYTNTLRPLKRGKWWVILHKIRHTPNLLHARRALKAAVSSEAWHAVMQLVRLETDVTQRDSLFRDMVRLRQWAVCRELLEQGVSHPLCLGLLSELIEHSQWTLAAMVMECPMDDQYRKEVMHQAIMMREGSVVWECIKKMQTRLSVEEREDLFQLAFNREVWQAVKPLIEEQDETGIRHRDTALLEAIEQHQWDVVDHCQRHHADINMKDDDGHTPIHRAARKGDWEAVKELTVRDGDPNLLDRKGLSVLHRAIEAKQWAAVKLLIQFHGDIHHAKRHGSTTPLRMLIDARQGEAIESTLMWCPDQQKGVNNDGETALHAVCLSGWPDTLYHLIARKVDPLAVTYRGHTALYYGVLCKDCPQRMVAECIQMGFSTHQPHFTDITPIYIWSDTSDESDDSEFDSVSDERKHRLVRFPLMLAVIQGLPVVAQMMYESGACSNRQLFEIHTYLANYTSLEGRLVDLELRDLWQTVYVAGKAEYSRDTELLQKSADYLKEMCNTPRSLVSTCRLVISRRLTLSKTRHNDITQLPLSPRMKNYLMFSDLTDPQYPDLSYRGKE